MAKLRVLQGLVALGLSVVALEASAQDAAEDPKPKDPQASQAEAPPAAAEEPAAKPTAEDASTKPMSEELSAKASLRDVGVAKAEAAPVVAPAPSAPEEKPAEKSGGWHTFVTGAFRAPFAMGFSPRPGPDNPNGPPRMQVSYGPTRTVDASYYSFAYTRLQEQDWAELFVHAKKKHAEAVIGWMGYWFQGAGFRNADASWAPGAAYLTLDTDFEFAGAKPNIAITAGAWWPKFGTFDKYETFTLGRFRQLGEQIKLTIPFNPDLTLTLVQGFGTNRDGSFNYTVQPPMYAAKIGMDLIHYDHIQLTYKKYLDAGLHFNTQWSRDPNLRDTNVVGDKSYSVVEKAYVLTVGGEVSVNVPYAGRFWVSPSYIKVRNGWTLANGGVEVMHSLGGAGIASNYMAWADTPTSSTGTGSMLNLGFLYENKLSGILGKEPGAVMPELTLNVFGMMANASLDLPAGTLVTQDRIKQFKYGADLTVQVLTWLGFMARFDEVNYDLDHSGYVFSGITGRAILSTHFLSSESIYLQYTRYRYGDMMVLNGMWPWKQELIAGNYMIQHGPYAGQKPDMDVVKVQANVTF